MDCEDRSTEACSVGGVTIKSRFMSSMVGVTSVGVVACMIVAQSSSSELPLIVE